MAKKEHRILAVDIGGDTLKMAEFVIGADGAAILENFAVAPMDTRDRDSVEVFAETYKQLLDEHKFKAHLVRLGVPGQTSFSRLCKLPQVGGGGSGLGRIVAFEARQAIPYDMSEVIWGYQPLQHKIVTTRTIEPEVEGGETITETEESEELEALIVAVKEDQVVAYSDVILNSGKKILSVDVAPVALFNAARASQCKEDESVLLLNIGGRSTSLVIADHNRVFIRTIPIAGDLITQQISKEFSMPFPEAEEFKIRHGSVALGGAYEEPESEVEATISKISRNIMTRLHGEISRSINVWRAQHGGNPPGRLLLAGGGSLMRYLPEFFKEKLRIPVDFLNCFTVIGIAPGIDREKLLDVAPMFPELTGMCLHSIISCPVEISLIPQFISNQEAFQRKKPFLYGSAATLLVCLLIVLVSVHQRMYIDRTRVEKVQEQVERTKKLVDETRRSYTALNQADGEYQETRKIIDGRYRWTKLLKTIQAALPNTMFLVGIEGIGTVVQNAPSGGGGGGGFGGLTPESGPAAGAVRTSSEIRLGEIDAATIREVKEIRLKGYSLLIGKQDMLEDVFRSNLKKLDKEIFALENDSDFLIEQFTPARGENNISAFIIRLKLKEPIKK